MNHDKLMCDVHSISYDYVTKIGIVKIDYGCTDMAGTINLFTALDPAVRRIYTFSGDGSRGLDTYYVLNGNGEWDAVCPR